MMSALYYTSSSSLRQQSVGRHAGPFGNIMLIPNQPVFDLTPSCCVQHIPNLIVHVFKRPVREPTTYCIR